MVKARVFVLGRQADKDRDIYEPLLRASNTVYDEYIDHDFSVLASTGIRYFAALDFFAKVLLRTIWPSDIILFMFPPAFVADFDAFIAGRFGSDVDVQGFADIDNGVAYAFADIFDRIGTVKRVKHELLHMERCSTFHDSKGDHFVDVEGRLIFKRHPNAKRLPWCRDSK